MHQGYKSFEDLQAWQLARTFKNHLYGLTAKFPKEELYSLVSQLRRAAISITANIAEGWGRYSYQENIQFCRIARGSVNECLDHLYTALDQGYIVKSQFDNLYAEGREVEHAINGYLKFLNSQR